MIVQADIFKCCLLSAFLFISFGCSKGALSIEDMPEDDFIKRYSVEEKRTAFESDTLKILSIGNSLGEDALMFFPDILSAAGVKDVTVGRLCCLGISFKDHYNNFKHNNSRYTFYISSAGSKWVIETSVKTIREAILFDTWDVVVFQDSSGYVTFLDNTAYGLAKEMVESIRSVLNKSVSFYWHLPWSYGRNYDGSTFAPFDYDQKKMDDYIKEVDKRLISLGYGIIPSYETIASLRQSSINNPPLDLTRDGLHADYGTGRYSVSCTWYQILIYPFSHVSIEGNPFRSGEGNVPVDDTVAGICQNVVSNIASRRKSLI